MGPQVGQTVNLPGGIASGVAPGGSEYKTGAGPTKIIGTRTVNGQNYYNIDQSGIGGGTGWVAGSALNGISGPAAAPATAPATAPSGGGGTGFSMPTAPTFDLVGATNAAFNTPEIQAAQKAVSDRQAALAAAEGEVNDNPFYSEATRVGKLAQLRDQANADISVQQNILSGLKADAQIKLNAALGQYNINEQQYKDTLAQFDTMLQAGGLTYAAPGDLAAIATSTGIPVSELQSIQQKQQQDNIKTSLVTSNDGTVSVINSQTGKIISQTQPGVGPVSKPAGSATFTENASLGQAINDMNSAITGPTNTITGSRVLGGDGFMSPDSWTKLMATWMQNGLKQSDFVANYQQYTNPNDNYQGLGKGKGSSSGGGGGVQIGPFHFGG